MENVKMVEKLIIVPEKPTKREKIYLSNIDLGLVSYQDSVSFFDPPSNGMTFKEACQRLYDALRKMLVPYAFVAGRLIQEAAEDRFQIDTNDAGVVVVAAETQTRLDHLGHVLAPKQESRQFIAFLHMEDEDHLELKDKPLAFLQFTRLGCGSLALASRFNHCILDGIGVFEFERNLAALTRGDQLVTVPNPDRTVFKARNPPQIKYPHLEYSYNNDINNNNVLFSVRGIMTSSSSSSYNQNNIHLIHLPSNWIAKARKSALQDGKLKNCSAFQAVAAKIWKSRSIALNMTRNSTMLFPVDCRKRVVPQAPEGFAGNGLVPGYARATMRELEEKEDSYLVRKVQEGVERLTDEYVKSGIDWLEVNGGTPRTEEDSFSLVAWWRLGLEEEEFGWGKLKYATLITLKPGLVILLPGGGGGGLSVCLEFAEEAQAKVFRTMLQI